jgi:anion-transporting  ArsA/GET3 family ATPase
VCKARRAIQAKYLAQMADLYLDFHVTKVPVQPEEIRGPALVEFSQVTKGQKKLNLAGKGGLAIV